MTIYYAIDTETKALDIMEYDEDSLSEDLKFFGVKNALQLDSPDWKVFSSLENAEDWKLKYVRTMRLLNGKTYKKSESFSGLPCLLYKKRWIAQAILGDKLSTQRHFSKDWKVGDKFYFHDQTNFILCVLTKPIKEVGKSQFKYEYKIVKDK